MGCRRGCLDTAGVRPYQYHDECYEIGDVNVDIDFPPFATAREAAGTQSATAPCPHTWQAFTLVHEGWHSSVKLGLYTKCLPFVGRV